MLTIILGGLIAVALILLAGKLNGEPIPRKWGKELKEFLGMNLIAFMIGCVFAAAFWQ